MLRIGNRISSRIICTSLSSFSKKKDLNDDNEDIPGDFTREVVEIDEKYRKKSALLYDKYLKERERPALTLDNYQIHYSLVIERAPIFLPYHPRKFNYYQTRYRNIKRSNNYTEMPKDLQIESGEYLFEEYERVNPENIPTHRNEVSRTEISEYAENSRYWKYTDPDIQDPKSIQTYSSDNVFFIVKFPDGTWKFPSRRISEKDNHKEIFTHFSQELFGGSPNPLLFFYEHSPVWANQVQDQALDRGKGYYDLFYKGITINGIPSFPTSNYTDYAWVPKPHLSQYFHEDYFKTVIPLTAHIC